MKQMHTRLYNKIRAGSFESAEAKIFGSAYQSVHDEVWNPIWRQTWIQIGYSVFSKICINLS